MVKCVNKTYKYIEMEIDAAFQKLLLLKKKQYAGYVMTRTHTGEMQINLEVKGLDMVRRDRSQLCSEASNAVLNHIFSNQPDDQIYDYLRQLKDDVHSGKVPESKFIITKQLQRDPIFYIDGSSLPHVQVALRYNQKAANKLVRKDMVPYLVCEDGTGNGVSKRAYHIDEFRNSNTLKIDFDYYIEHEVYHVVKRLYEPITNIDIGKIKCALKIGQRKRSAAQIFKSTFAIIDVRYGYTEPFLFTCFVCNTENRVRYMYTNELKSFLEKCSGRECRARPVDHLESLKKQLDVSIKWFIKMRHHYELECQNPACMHITADLLTEYVGRHPICMKCKCDVMLDRYSAKALCRQLEFFSFLFSIDRHEESKSESY